MAGWREVRVFISSTFRDMHAERDHLVKAVFPALRERLLPHRLHLTDIDLRWGVTQEQADNDQVLDLCLDEIDRCRPFFIGLLGERYGWVPTKYPVRGESKLGWVQAHLGKSVTELEILYGVLDNPAMRGHAFFYFRDPACLDEIPEPLRSAVYVDTDEDGRAALATLKQRLLRSGFPVMAPYPARWQGGGLGGLADFGECVLEQLWSAIEAQYGLTDARLDVELDPLAKERDYHEQFVEARLRVYVQRPVIQQEMLSALNARHGRPVLVSGPSGSGKSALLARLCRTTEGRIPLLISHFVGASPGSTSIRQTLRRFCLELQAAFAFDDEIPDDYAKLVITFAELLGEVPEGRTVAILVDAVNQLDETDDAHLMAWLPDRLPAWVKLVVTCIDDPDREQVALQALRARGVPEVRVPRLADSECEGIVRAVPSLTAKSLDGRQTRLLLENPATRNPLFLLVALEELRGFGSFERLNERIRRFPRAGDTVTAIFGQVLVRLERDFDAAVVRQTLCYLAVARNGLPDAALTDLVRDLPGAGDLQPVLRQLRPYLQRRGERVDFFHRNLFKAVRAKYLTDGAEQRLWHQRLADYLEGCGWSHRVALEELPWHQLQAADWDGLTRVLTDLGFLEGKCRAGLLVELKADYAAALAAGTDPVDGQLGAIDRETADWIARDYAAPPPRSWLTRQEQGEEPAAADGRGLDSLRPWSVWLDQQTHTLRRLGYREGYLFQVAYNSASCGPVAEAAGRCLEAGRGPTVPWLRLINRPPYDLNPVRTLFQGGSQLWTAAFSGNGRYAAVGGDGLPSGTAGICLLDLATGQERFLAGRFWSPSVSSTGVVLVPDSHSIHEWDSTTGNQIEHVLAEGESVLALRHGRTLVKRDGRLFVRSLACGEGASASAPTRDGDRTRSVSPGWRAKSPDFEVTLPAPPRDGSDPCYGFSADLLHVGCLGEWHELLLVEIASGRTSALPVGAEGVAGWGFAGATSRAVVAYNDRLEIWDTAAMSRLREIVRGRIGGAGAFALAFALSTDGRLAVLHIDTLSYELWDLVNVRKVRNFGVAVANRNRAVDLTPDGRHVIASSDCFAWIWSMCAPPQRPPVSPPGLGDEAALKDLLASASHWVVWQPPASAEPSNDASTGENCMLCLDGRSATSAVFDKAIGEVREFFLYRAEPGDRLPRSSRGRTWSGPTGDRAVTGGSTSAAEFDGLLYVLGVGAPDAPYCCAAEVHDGLEDAVWSADGLYLATRCFATPTPAVWKLENVEPLPPNAIHHREPAVNRGVRVVCRWCSGQFPLADHMLNGEFACPLEGCGSPLEFSAKVSAALRASPVAEPFDRPAEPEPPADDEPASLLHAARALLWLARSSAHLTSQDNPVGWSAQCYIERWRELAAGWLRELLDRWPDDPLAEEAGQLLRGNETGAPP